MHDDAASRPGARPGGRRDKPRTRGLTEIRAPHHAPISLGHAEDVLGEIAPWVDLLALGGGAASLVPRRAMRALVELCHGRRVRVSSGRCLEYVVTLGAAAVERWLGEQRDLGVDVVDVSAGFLSLGDDELARLTEKVASYGLEPRPELGVETGAGAGDATELASIVARARRYLDAGAETVAVEPVGAGEGARALQAEVVLHLFRHVGREQVIFEAPDPCVMALYVQSFGADVNLSVDHAHALELESMRAGIFAPSRAWRHLARRLAPTVP